MTDEADLELRPDMRVHAHGEGIVRRLEKIAVIEKEGT